MLNETVALLRMPQGGCNEFDRRLRYDKPRDSQIRTRRGTPTETRIAIKLTIEGKGRSTDSTGIRFFDHMLELFTRHGAFDLELKCKGDLDVDQHHTVEDVGIALGEAFDRALGDKRGILRAGYFMMPMDETLAIAAVDLSGRAAFAVDTKVRTRLVGDLQTELVTDFFEGFARGARANVHVKTMYGRSNHHKIEAIFKAFARALRVACSRDKQLGEMLPEYQGTSLMRVTVIDYKAGNLTSVLKALRHLGAEVSDRFGFALIESAERIVLPGVGHFAATRRLKNGNDGSDSRAIARGVPFLGICVGMQWLYAGSTEAPEQPGTRRTLMEPARAFPNAPKGSACRLEFARGRSGSRLLAGFKPGEYVYFTHSYKAPMTEDTAAVANYIETFAAAVERGQCDGRAVSSGEVRRDRPEDPSQFSGVDHVDQAHHSVPRCPRGRVVKGVQFVDIVDAGDPAALAARHAREGADEIVLLDITATHEGRQTLLETVRRTAQRIVRAVYRRWRHSQRAEKLKACLRPERTKSALIPPRSQTPL